MSVCVERMPGEWAEALSPILNHETRHALKLFAVAGALSNDSWDTSSAKVDPFSSGT